MERSGDNQPNTVPAVIGSGDQPAIWFLGALVHLRLPGEASGGRLAVLHHEGPRGYGSPVHRHQADDELFLVLDGEIRILLEDRAHLAQAGATVFLPRRRAHAFVVLSDRARFLTVHTPAGFDEFALSVGTPAAVGDTTPPSHAAVGPGELATIAHRYGIEILGPPPGADDVIPAESSDHVTTVRQEHFPWTATHSRAASPG